MPYMSASGYADTGAGELGSYYLGDATPDYVNWVSQVKQNGGVVTNWPFEDEYKGDPAARYPLATYIELYNNGQIADDDTVQRAANGDWAYVLARANVAAAAQQLTQVTATEAARLPGAFSWNPFANVSTTGKVMAAAAGVTALAAVFGLFRGRR